MDRSKFNVKALKEFWRKAPQGRYLSLKEILCLGSASLGVSFICNIINMYITIGRLPMIYDMGDYGSLHATIAYLTACVGGLVLTPIYGKAIQHTKSKYGRYKPYILFAAPIVAALGVVAVWTPQNLSETQATIYMYCTSIPTLLVWNLWFNTWNLFPGVFSPNQQERVDIWSPIGLVMGFAPTVMNAIQDPIAALLGDVWAARIFGILSAVVGVACVIGLLKVKERVFVTEVENNRNKIGVITGLKMIWKNKPLLILTLALIAGAMRGTIDLVWQIVGRVKYGTDMMKGADLFGLLSIFVGFAATPNMLLLPLFTRKLNNRAIMLIWIGCNVAANFVLGIIGFQNFEQGTTSAIIITALRFVSAFNAIGSLQPLMLSEIGDYQQKLTGYRLDGFIQTMAYSVPLVFTQLFALIPAVIQGAIGFNPNNYTIIKDAPNVLTPELIATADQYFNIATWISFGSGLLMLICMCFYTLSKKKHAAIMAELQANAANKSEIENSSEHFSMNGEEVTTSNDESIGDNATESDNDSSSIDSGNDDSIGGQTDDLKF